MVVRPSAPSILLFDLSEVLISGLIGVESTLALLVGADESAVFGALGGRPLTDLCLGRCTELQYFDSVLERSRWPLDAEDLKSIVRRNFHTVIEAMPSLIERLAEHQRLVLVSDHGREWIAYIEEVHGFLRCFEQRIYSFETGSLKSQSTVFDAVLDRMGCAASDCLLIDDNPANVATATSVGIRSIQFEGRAALSRQLLALRVSASRH